MVQKGTRTAQVRAKDPRMIADMADHQAKEMQERSEKAAQAVEHFETIAKDIQEALSTGDVDRAGILAADLKSARTAVDATTKDIARVMIALGEQYKEIGVSIDALEKLNPDEQKIVDDAEAMFGRAKSDLAKAEKKMFNIFFGRRDKAIAKAKKDIESAEAGMKAAQEIASAKQRERLINADLSTSMQRIQACTQIAIDNAVGRVSFIEEDLQSVDAALVEGLAKREELVANIEVLTKNLTNHEAQLATLVAQRNEVQQGTEEAARLETEISEVTKERDKAREEQNKNFMVLQEQERFIEIYKTHVAGQRQFLEHHHAWVATLQMGVKERETIFDSQIGAMQATADQEAMKMIDDVATTVDMKGMEAMAKMITGGQKAILDRIERAPKDLKTLEEISEARAEARANFEKRLDDILEQFSNGYGRDTSYDSVASHRKTVDAA
ncbi:MAG: hypothetical protein HYT93_04740 [Parcubacteria group bacterium]|nr:hypothetical protein [Parcubacteria group bacterium]